MSADADTRNIPSREDLLLASRPAATGLREVRLSVPSIHCGGCLATIERTLGGLDGVAEARANLTTKSVVVRWPDGVAPPPIGPALAAVGHPPHLSEAAAAAPDRDLGDKHDILDANHAREARNLKVANEKGYKARQDLPHDVG